MKLTFAGLSEAGSREENQDCIYCVSENEDGIFLVADGMGGHQDGAFASRLIRGKVLKAWNSLQNSEEKENPGKVLTCALEESNAAIRACRPEGTVCGSTAAILYIQGSRYSSVCCGDSHIYLVRKTIFGRKIRLLTVDDVWENEPSNVTGMDAEQIINHRYYGRLLRAVGTQESFRCHRQEGKLRSGSLFVLASDGIYKYIPQDMFEKQLQLALRQAAGENGPGLMEQAEQIRKLVYEAGAPDNLSVILVYAERS